MASETSSSLQTMMSLRPRSPVKAPESVMPSRAHISQKLTTLVGTRIMINKGFLLYDLLQLVLIYRWAEYALLLYANGLGFGLASLRLVTTALPMFQLTCGLILACLFLDGTVLACCFRCQSRENSKFCYYTYSLCASFFACSALFFSYCAISTHRQGHRNCTSWYSRQSPYKLEESNPFYISCQVQVSDYIWWVSAWIAISFLQSVSCAIRCVWIRAQIHVVTSGKEKGGNEYPLFPEKSYHFPSTSMELC